MSKIESLKSLDPSIGAALTQSSVATDKAKALAGQEIKSEKELDKAASGFEALLLHEMLKSMWATIDTTGLLGEESNQSQIYRDMLNQAMSDSISEGRGIGVKDFVKREISSQQQASKK